MCPLWEESRADAEDGPLGLAAHALLHTVYLACMVPTFRRCLPGSGQPRLGRLV